MKFVNSQAARHIAALSLAFSCQAFGASTDTLTPIPGIDPPGNPAFINDVTLGLSEWSGGYKLSAEEIAGEPFLFQLGSQQYAMEDGSYRLTAYFDWSGNLDTQKSNVQVRGSFSEEDLAALADTERQHELWGGNLFSARLDDVGLSFGEDDVALAFGTTDFGGWASQYGTVESVWLYGFEPKATQLLPFVAGLLDGTLKATAYTTVPLPPAIWLFGSALLGYALVGHRMGLVKPGRLDAALS